MNGEVPDFQFHENGYLFLTGEKSKDLLLKNNKVQHECGATHVKLLDNQSLGSQFPWLNRDGLAMGSYGEQKEGYFDPWIFVNAMKKKNVSMGVEYIEGDILSANLLPVTTGSSEYTIDEVVLKRKSSSDTETLHATHVINCAGAWSGRLLNLFTRDLHRAKAVHPLPVVPRKRCIFAFHCKPSESMPPVKTPLTIDPTGVYFRPEGVQGGRFIAGVSPNEENDHDILEGSELEELGKVDHTLFEDVIWPALYERVPAFQEIKVNASWAGFYDYNTVDQNAIIGSHSEIRNLMLCTGFSGHGLQQSPAAGRAVAEWLQHKRFETIDLQRFSFERIVRNAPVFEAAIV